MKTFIARWGRSEVPYGTRHHSSRTEYGHLEFESTSLTAAKAKATRVMKVCEKMRRYVISEIEDMHGNMHPLSPPRWTSWDVVNTVHIKVSEVFDYPVVYVNPANSPKDPLLPHRGYLEVQEV